jgi:viologen exporter family transport system permease protein
MTALQYRASFLFAFGVGSVNTLGVVLPLWAIFGHWDAIAGWTFPQALLVTSFFLLLGALVGGLVEPNLGAVVEGVRAGQFDYLLIKPADAQLVASLQRVDPVRLWDVLGAALVAGWAYLTLPPPTLGGVAAAMALLLAGLASMYSLYLLVICLSFWFVRVDNLRYLLSAVTDAGRWPVSIYRGVVRVFLTVLVPVALATSWPAMALLGRMDAMLAFQAVAVAVGALAGSRFLWVQALRYASASS